MRGHTLPILIALLAVAACDKGGGPGTDAVDAPDVHDGVEAPDTPADTPADEVGDAIEDTIEDAEADCPDMIGSTCSGNWDCQDCSWCNGVEVCDSMTCAPGIPQNCTDTHDCTADSCSDELESCVHELDDSLCDNSIACDGAEFCDEALGCQDGPTVDCDDHIVCTLDECNEPAGNCTNVVTDAVCDDSYPCTVDVCVTTSDTCTNTLIDADHDTYPPTSCGGPDCDDTDPTRYPWADESCTDGVDSNCNGLPDVSDPVCCTGSGDTCDCPVDMTTGGALSGSTAGMMNDYCGTCGASPCGFDGADVAFYLSVPETSIVNWSFSGLYANWYVHLHEGSCTGTEVMCERPYSSSALVSEILDPGYYFLILDASDAMSAGSYSVTTTMMPVVRASGNDSCSSATPVTLGATHAGSLTGLVDDYLPSCSYGWSGNDAAFRLDLSSSTTVTMTTDGTLWDTFLYVLDSSCADTGLPCDDNSGSTGYGTSRITTTLPAGTYYIVLDESWAGSGTDYLFTITSP